MIDSIISAITSILNGSLLFQLGIGIWNGLIGYAWDILQTNPQNLADGMLWDTADGIFQLLQIVGASLMTVLFLINFVKETADSTQNKFLKADRQQRQWLIIPEWKNPLPCCLYMLSQNFH